MPLYVKVLVDGAFSSDAHLSTYNEIIQTLERSTDVPKYTFVKSSDNDLGNLTVSYSSCILDPTTSKLETHDFEVGFYGIKDTINITDGLMNGKELEASGDLEFDSNSTCNLVLNVENAIEDSVIFHGIAHEVSSNGSVKPIYEADIIVFDEDGHKLSACKTGEDGIFEFAVAKKDIENKYIKTISCFAEGYVAQYQTYTSDEIEAATVISKNFDLKTGLKVDVDVKDIINFADFNVNVEKDSELISLQDIIKNDSFYFPAGSQVTFDKTNKKATFSYIENAAIKVTLIADPQEGNDFNSWLYNNEIVGDETKTINEGDKISANFNHVVILKSADSKMGKVSNGSESQAQFVLSVNHGAELIVDNNKVIIGENEFTAIPEEGYEFVSWEEVDNSVTEATTYQANFKVTESPEPAPDPEKGSSADYSDTAQTGDISQYALVGLIIVVATIYVFARKKFFN
ncbi:MAG: hypothetical protein Q4E88_00975 [Coriobacteriia bacterium]|nr:hypothetical protein [Coriobacteriia bacterium]